MIIRCNQCRALMINGVFCHETGCQNMKSRFDEEIGEWVRQYVCGECGSSVDDGETCCQDLDEGDDEEEDEETQADKFILELELGNAAMQTYADIAKVVARLFADFSGRTDLCADDYGRLYDANGNKVGFWRIDE